MNFLSKLFRRRRDAYYGVCYAGRLEETKAVWIENFSGFKEGTRLTVTFIGGFSAPAEGERLFFKFDVNGITTTEVLMSCHDGYEGYDSEGYIVNPGGTMSFIFHEGCLPYRAPYFTVDGSIYAERAIVADCADIAASVEPYSVDFSGLSRNVQIMIANMSSIVNEHSNILKNAGLTE